MEKVKRRDKIARKPAKQAEPPEPIQIEGARTGVYLYCIFHGGEYAFALEKGIDNANAIFSIKYGDIEALASYVPLNEYDEPSLERNLQDLKWIAPRAQAHERIIESVMRFCTVIPIKFCTIFTDEFKVSEILKQNFEKFKSLLDYLNDKQEWGIKVYVDGSKISEVDFDEFSSRLRRDFDELSRVAQSSRFTETFGEALGESSAEIKELDGKVSVASEGAAYFLKKKRDVMLKENAEKILRALTEKIFEKLRSWSVESRRNKLLGRQSTGRNDDMILNVAILLTRSDVEKVKSQIDKLAAGYSSKGFIFELSGPWPPYNFCTERIEGVQSTEGVE